MIRRVAVDGLFTEHELKALADHIVYEDVEMRGPEKIDYLRSLYAKLPRNMHYTGPIYRGVSIDRRDALAFLQNNTFTLGEDLMGDQRLVESWTYKKEVALEFVSFEVAQVNTSYELGVVVASDTHSKDVVGVFDEDVYRYIAENADPDAVNNYLGYTWAYRNELEVMAISTGKMSFNMCQDVAYIMVNNRNVFEQGDGRIKEALFLNMDQTSVEAVKGTMEDGELPVASVYACDGSGKLSMIVPDYTADVQIEE